MRRRGNVGLTVLGGMIVLLLGAMTLAHLLPAPAGRSGDETAFLGFWRIFAGSVILAAAALQVWKRRVGGAIAALFGAFETVVTVTSQDVLHGVFIPLAGGPLLALAGGAWAFFVRRQASEPARSPTRL